MSSPAQPVTPRPAATVMLLRATDAGPEVFLQRRVKAMKFAPSVTVFPGGGLDERDQVISRERWHGPAPSWWAERFGCAEDLAAALVCAAIRETFEECGVLLAGTNDGAPLGSVPAELAAARAELVEHKVALPELLAEHNWVLRADMLRPWSNWITPEVEKRRYDTRFFVAELPPGQHADARNTEVTEAGWRRPSDALTAWHAGDLQLLPPTWVTLEQLSVYSDITDCLRAGEERPITPLIPKVRREGDKVQLHLPGELGYEDAPLSLSPRQLPVVLNGEKRPAGLLPEEQRAEHPRYERVRPVTATASVLLADNPSEMTLEGTNTWLLRGPGAESIVVVDPGPLDETHLRLISEQGPVALILLTHRHQDHTEGAPRLAQLTGAPVRALQESLTSEGATPFTDSEVITAAGLELRVLTTPGHTSDSVSFLLEDAVLTGDTILGRGTTVIDHPDGTLADYLRSLRRLAELSDSLVVLPGHGPELPSIGAVTKQYLEHREQRLNQVRAALTEIGSDASARQVVEHVYADIDQSLWRAAEWSVEAQLTYLRAGA